MSALVAALFLLATAALALRIAGWEPRVVLTDAVTTRGDANAAPERWSIPADGTVGRLRLRLAGVGELAAPLRGEISRGLAGVTLAALLAAVALWAIWRPRGGRPAPARRPAP